MSRDASLTLAFGDAEHRFRLALGELRELQEKTKAGPMALLRRLQSGDWRVDDAREILRIGLVGGGLKPVEALALVTRYVDGFPLLDAVPPAIAVLGAALFGAEDEPVGNGAAAEAASGATETSPSPPSTEPAQP